MVTVIVIINLHRLKVLLWVQVQEHRYFEYNKGDGQVWGSSYTHTMHPFTIGGSPTRYVQVVTKYLWASTHYYSACCHIQLSSQHMCVCVCVCVCVQCVCVSELNSHMYLL